MKLIRQLIFALNQEEFDKFLEIHSRMKSHFWVETFRRMMDICIEHLDEKGW